MRHLPRTILPLIATALCLTAPESIQAKLTLPAYYASNMVLQQNMTFAVHGRSVPGRTVRVICSWNNTHVDGTVAADSTFSVDITTPAATMTPCKIDLFEIEMRDGKRFRTFDQKRLAPVYIGEVWLCSGQSNMEMTVTGWGLKDSEKEKALADSYPNIKLLRVTRTANRNTPSDKEQLDFSWTKCSSSRVADFSALAYMYGRILYDSLKVPVGIIECAYGAANAEAWISLGKLRQIPQMKSSLDKYAAYDFDINKIKAAGVSVLEQCVPTLLYNTMLHPLKGYPIRGAIWYQGEGNVGYNYYTQLMDTLISSWRQDWGYTFPFYYMQIAGFGTISEMNMSSGYARLRWDQNKTLEMPQTGMATCVDIGDPKDIHPKNKQEAARRMALLALRHTYGYNVVAEAPTVESIKFSRRKAVIKFTGPVHVKNDSVPVGFILRDKLYSSKYTVGKAEVTGDSVITVTTTNYMTPRAVIYNWADCPVGNVYGDNGLPVLPFNSEESIVNAVSEVKVAGEDKYCGRAEGVFSADGEYLGSSRDAAKLRLSLPDGIYIINGKKELIRKQK